MTVDVATVAFWIIAVVLVGSALAVVLKNIVHAALLLIVVFGAAAGIYVLLNAEFIAIVQILIYAGAVAVLDPLRHHAYPAQHERISNPFSGQWWLAALICILLGGGIIYAVAQRDGRWVAISSSPGGFRSGPGGTVVGWANCCIARSPTATCCPLKLPQ